MTPAEKQVVDILLADEVDYKKIAIEIAKNYPDIFLVCVANRVLTAEEIIVIPYLKRGEKINAIKALRTHRQTYGGDDGLKVCKDFIDALSDKMATERLNELSKDAKGELKAEMEEIKEYLNAKAQL